MGKCHHCQNWGIPEVPVTAGLLRSFKSAYFVLQWVSESGWAQPTKIEPVKPNSGNKCSHCFTNQEMVSTKLCILNYFFAIYSICRNSRSLLIMKKMFLILTFYLSINYINILNICKYIHYLNFYYISFIELYYFTGDILSIISFY